MASFYPGNESHEVSFFPLRILAGKCKPSFIVDDASAITLGKV
jgi:hypothetical protein